jgi:predicted PhzF superfamily epimerase YddE/YHI9
VGPSEHILLKVFVGEDGGGGNPLGIFLDGGAVPRADRQAIATELNYSETVFVDDCKEGRVEIYTPAAQIPFAGHPLVGTAWLLAEQGGAVGTLRPPAGEVGVSQEGELTFIAADPSWTIDFEYVQYGSPAEVDALEGAPDGMGFAYCWAWIDESEGAVRARAFVPAEGIAEDEATGSAALTLGCSIGREVEIRQGVGSELYVRPLDENLGEVGGRVERVT